MKGEAVRKRAVVALTAATVLVAGGYYGVADALDIVPGFITLSSDTVQVAPLPTPSVPAPDAATPAAWDENAPVPSKSDLASLADTLASDELVGKASTGASVIDVATGATLLSHGADTALTPASSNKILVAWAALSALGPEHRLTTSTVLSGSVVTLVGGGDVLLSADQGDPNAVVGHAGLGDLAQETARELTSRGMTKVTVALDDTLFSGPTWNEKWEDGNESWVAPIQPIMIDVTAHEGGYPSDPAMEAAQTFASALRSAGITVEGDVSRAAAAVNAQELASVDSATLAEILSVSLKASDNTMTEVEGHLLAAQTGYPATFAGGVQAVEAQLKKDGFDITGLTLYDSSGLAKANKVPTRLLAQVMARAAGKDGGSIGRTLIADIPVAHLDGTLSDRFADTDAAGRLRAKTGSLDQTASLTGVVMTRGGRLLAFSVIVDGFDEGGLYAARVALDRDFAAPLADL